jgi:hypothetical protein
MPIPPPPPRATDQKQRLIRLSYGAAFGFSGKQSFKFAGNPVLAARLEKHVDGFSQTVLHLQILSRCDQPELPVRLGRQP